MTEEVSVHELNEIDYHNFIYTAPIKIKGSGYKTLLTVNNQPLCFSLILNKKNNIDNNTITFQLDDTNIQLLKEMENSFITKAYENRYSWFSADFPLDVLEGFYKSFITDNTFTATISEEDISSIYNTEDNSTNYDDFKENTRIEVVFLIESLVFLKKEFFCNIQIKQINEMNYYLVNYNSDDEDNIDINNMEIDLENSEVVDLTDNIIDLEKEIMEKEIMEKEIMEKEIMEKEIMEKEIMEKTRIMEEVKEELELLKKTVVEKEKILSSTEEELSKLTSFC